MGIHLTNSKAIALYCSVTDWAFGPIFECREAAEAFCEWHRMNYGSDLRSYTDKELENIYTIWRRETKDVIWE